MERLEIFFFFKRECKPLQKDVESAGCLQLRHDALCSSAPVSRSQNIMFVSRALIRGRLLLPKAGFGEMLRGEEQRCCQRVYASSSQRVDPPICELICILKLNGVFLPRSSQGVDKMTEKQSLSVRVCSPGRRVTECGET